MLITCRLWKAIKKYSLRPEVNWSHSVSKKIPHLICSRFQYNSVMMFFFFQLPYRMPSLTDGKFVFYFSTYPSVRLLDSSIGSTTCTVNQEVSIKLPWRVGWLCLKENATIFRSMLVVNSKYWGMCAALSIVATKYWVKCISFTPVSSIHRLYFFRGVWVSCRLLQHGLPSHGCVGF